MKSQRTFARSSSALLMAGLIAVGWPAQAGADPSGNSITDQLTKLGQELCPKLVKPGSELAANASKLRGDSGLTPEITRLVAGFAIQMQCPAFMAAVARGDLPKMLSKAGKDAPALPFPLPGLPH